MILYIGLTHPVDPDTEEKIEAHLREWFNKYRVKLLLVGFFPYDPIAMEFSIDIGDQPHELIVESLERWIARLKQGETDLLVSTRGVLEGMSREERGEYLKRKMIYLIEEVRRMNRARTSSRLRRLEYLLSGTARELEKLLQAHPPLALPPAPIEDGLSRKLDEFWKKL